MNGPADLSARERQVLARVALGETNAQIAHALGLSPWTVKTYLENAYRKLGAVGRRAAVTAALRVRGAREGPPP